MKPEKIYTVVYHSSINDGKMQDFTIDSSFLDYHAATERLNEIKFNELINFKVIYGDHQYTVIHDEDDKCVIRTLNDDDILTIKIKTTFLYK